MSRFKTAGPKKTEKMRPESDAHADGPKKVNVLLSKVKMAVSTRPHN